MTIEQQYKNEVSSLRLSDSFKQSLKESMAKEFATVAVNQTSKRPWIKYSKYIATAACLVLIVATVSVVSLMGGSLRVEKSADDASQINMYDSDVGFDGVGTEDMPVSEENTVLTEEADDFGDDEAVLEEDEVEEVVEEDVVDDEEETVSTSTDEEEAESAPTDEPVIIKSAYAPEDYDGEYYAEDYIVGNAPSPDFEALNVTRNVDLLFAFDGSIADEVPATPEEALGDDYEDEGMSYSELCLNVLPELDSVNFVRFSITDVYSADEAYEITGDEDFLNSKTLYEINVNYDYINGEELDLTMNMAALGTSENQLAGRPVFEDGDRMLACLTFDNDGYVEMLDELVYTIHRINGLDVAYHLTGGEGIDPGYTNMGMLDIEQSVITSTVNNPARYTHKAAVKELYRYLRRNWTRQEFEFTDFTEFGSLSGSEVENEPDVETDVTPSEERVEELSIEMAQGEVKVSIEDIEFDPKGEISSDLLNKLSSKGFKSTAMHNSSRVEFDGTAMMFDSVTVFRGKITEITTSANKPVDILVNGVGIKDSLSELVKAFGIEEYVDGKLSLNVATTSESGIPYVISIEVEDNVIKQMIIR